MTLQEVWTLGLKRVGLSPSNTTFSDQMRIYVNVVAKQIANERNWWWLNKTATFNTVVDTRTYTLAADVLMPESIVDETNDTPTRFVSQQVGERADPDRSTSTPTPWWTIEGYDETGALIIGAFPTPSEVATFRYRYTAYISDWTPANDGSQLNTLGIPTTIQPALAFGGARLYKQEKGDEDGAKTEEYEYEKMMSSIRKQQYRIEGNRHFRKERTDRWISGFRLQPQEGSLS